MLKSKLATLDGLSADIAKEYKKEGDVFILDLEGGIEDVGALKRALDHERTQGTARQSKIVELEKAFLDASKTRDPSEMEKAYQAKLADQKKTLEGARDSVKNQLQKKLVDDVAAEIAKGISTAPHLITPHILRQLTIEEVGGEFVTRVLDENGKVTALSVNEFRDKLVADPQYAPIIIGSKASGSGAQSGGKSNPGGGAKGFKEMSESEKVTLFKTNRAEFDRLRAAS